LATRSSFNLDFIVAGDCKVVVENAKREPLFHFWFNTSMVDMNTDGKAVLNLSKVALDGALAKDKSSKLVQESFRIELLMVRCKDKERERSRRLASHGNVGGGGGVAQSEEHERDDEHSAQRQRRHRQRRQEACQTTTRATTTTSTTTTTTTTTRKTRASRTKSE
jgi:hypothetical protein